jgi:pilus assembly protein CpaF
MVDARLADGSRVNVIIPPLVPASPTLTIRKFRTDRYTMTEMIEGNTVTEGLATFLEGCVRSRLNIVVSGGTGTGKTTFLNALSGYLGGRERIVTIEDPLELRLQQRHVVRMEARPPSTEGRGEVTQRTLFRNADVGESTRRPGPESLSRVWSARRAERQTRSMDGDGFNRVTCRAKPPRSVRIGHCEGEHPPGIDACVPDTAVQHLGPLVAVQGQIDVENCLFELRVLLGVDIDELGVTMDGDRERLTREVRGADRRTFAEVAVAQ